MIKLVSGKHLNHTYKIWSFVGRYILIIGVVCVVVAAVLWRSTIDKNAKRVTPTPKVEIISAQKSEISDNIQVVANTYANEAVDITAPVTELIDKVYFEDGQRVKKGDLLVQLDHTEELAQLKVAKLELKEHKRELARLKPLIEKHAISRREYDERETQKNIAQQNIQRTKVLIADRTIHAPFDGYVGIRQISPGALVAPGQSLTKLVDIDTIKLDFKLPAVYLSQLSQGSTIKASTEAFPGQLFEAKIATFEQQVDPVSRTILVRAIIDNKSGLLKPGLFMNVHVLNRERESVMLPEESVLQKKDGHFVWVVDGEQVYKRDVTIGSRKTGYVEIVSGVEDGDSIVVRGVHKVRDGQFITTEPWQEAQQGGNV